MQQSKRHESIGLQSSPHSSHPPPQRQIMLTLEQTKQFTEAAFVLIATEPGLLPQEFRAKVHELVGGDDWRDSDGIVLQDVVLLAYYKAYAQSTQDAKDAIEAKSLAEWKARMDAPAVAAPVYATTVTPVFPKTYAEHIDAIRMLYDGTDPENRAFDLAAACAYALANGITADQVAGATGRHHSECSAVMYPVK